MTPQAPVGGGTASRISGTMTVAQFNITLLRRSRGPGRGQCPYGPDHRERYAYAAL